jgi:hypothetical protein
MSLPYLFSSSFDSGDNTQWDSEADTGAKLDFPHYTELARTPGYPAPYRGAYCMRIADIADTNDHTLTAGAINVSASGVNWTRFAMYISPDFSATADDIFNIYELQATGTVETAISLRITAATDVVEIGIGETAAATFPHLITKGSWHIVELSATIDSGAPGDGTSTLYVDNASVQTIASLDQGAITDGVLGTQNTLATTDTGFILFDEFASDDTRMSITHRFHSQRLITQDSFLFVGAGRIDNVKIIGDGNTDTTLELYDTDVFNASMEPVWFGQAGTASVDVDAADVPIDFSRGCLALLAGTGPTGAQFVIGRATGWGSDGAIRTHAARRKAAPGGL